VLSQFHTLCNPLWHILKTSQAAVFTSALVMVDAPLPSVTVRVPQPQQLLANPYKKPHFLQNLSAPLKKAASSQTKLCRLNFPAYTFSTQTAQKTLFIIVTSLRPCRRHCACSMAVSNELPSNGCCLALGVYVTIYYHGIHHFMTPIKCCFTS
jgi:hypothetical protein